MTLAKKTIVSVLKKYGFKYLYNSHDARCYGIGDQPGKERYAEIIKLNTGETEVLVIGKDIVTNKSISYPGGRSFYEPAELDKYLKTLPKFKL